jgi:hypothetical protein
MRKQIRKPKSLKIVKRKLFHKGRRYYGLAVLEDGHATISIDPILNKGAKEMLNTTVHESLHIGDWLCNRSKDLNENEVDIIATNICNILWKQGYRRTDIK